MLYTKSLKMLFPVHFTFWHVILCRWDVSWCLLSIGKGKGWWYFTSAASRTAVIFIPFLIVSGSLSHNPVEFSFCLVDHPQCLLLWVCCLWFRLMNLLESTEAMHGGLIISKMVFDLFLPNSSVGDFFFLSFGRAIQSVCKFILFVLLISGNAGKSLLVN